MKGRDLLGRLVGRNVVIRYIVGESVVDEDGGCLEKVEDGVIVLRDPMDGSTIYLPDRVTVYKVTVYGPCSG